MKMRFKFFIFLLFLSFLIISCVYGGNNTSSVVNPTIHSETGVDTVTALESGDSNISFSDDYKGYCIEWGEHSAESGDTFYIHNDADNNIKTFFVYFYKESQKDVIATQHMIWKFTDNKEFSRFNQTLYNQIIDKAKTVQVPNDGTLKINNTTEMVFSFRTFISPIEEYQNYFGYQIFFRNITCQINNSTVNNITLIPQQLQNYTGNFTFNEIVVNDSDSVVRSSTSIDEKIVFSSHLTGINFTWLITCVIILLSIYVIIRFSPKY